MELHAMKNRMSAQKGVSLVEVMIALVILLIVFIGLIQASLLTIQANVRNSARDEAVRITADQMDRLRAASFDDMNRDSTTDADPLNYSIIYGTAVATTTRPDLRRQLRGATVDYTVTVTICGTSCALDANHKRITVTTGWSWQGETFTHSAVTVRIRS
jgi:prepilin-type N-terminal cleavage/methylation domain-containing protein